MACVAVTALAACGSQTTTATDTKAAATPTSGSASAPTTPSRPELVTKPINGINPSILKEEDGIRCNPAVGAIDLKIGGSTKGFHGGMIKVTPFEEYVIIDWGNEGANTLVVNSRRWGSAAGDVMPMPARIKLFHADWTYIMSIQICGFGN